MIPIVVISFNNYKYVENTINQLNTFGLLSNVTVLDNSSCCKDTLNYLLHLVETTAVKVIFSKTNEGPWICPRKNASIYHTLPDKFIITDPDLEFNKNLPNNFCEILSDMSDYYQCQKIGFALDISEPRLMFQTNNYTLNKSIVDWESKFWKNKINTIETPWSSFELYYAEIDTTFCLINKLRNGNQIRVAGDFTAKHLPWYHDNSIYSMHENYTQAIFNCSQNKISTISGVINDFVAENFLKIHKNDEFLLIENTKSDQNLEFWKNIYSSWEIETFNVFDKFLDYSKIFIDIGGWIGTTSIYGSRKSKHVYSIEADSLSFIDLTKNINLNCKKGSTTLINKAIFNVDDVEIKFGKNKYLQNSKMNDSTSQIYNNMNDENMELDTFSVKTITLQRIIDQYKIDPVEISLIKVDIEGGEENILDDLFVIHEKFKVSLFVSFHYDWWQNKDLDRFDFLSSSQKNTIRDYPFTSLLFNKI